MTRGTTPEACTNCAVTLYANRVPRDLIPDGARRHAGHGLCVNCYDRQRRAGRVAPPRPSLTRPLDPDEAVGAWKLNAACRDKNPDWFVPAGDKDKHYLHAREVCNGTKHHDGSQASPPCPVRDACLRYALRTETASTRNGMYGGTTPRERAAIALEMTP